MNCVVLLSTTLSHKKDTDFHSEMIICKVILLTSKFVGNVQCSTEVIKLFHGQHNQYPLHRVTCASVKLEVATITSNILGDAFKKKYLTFNLDFRVKVTQNVA